MKLNIKKRIGYLLLLFAINLNAQYYHETMNPDGLRKDLKTDYNLINDNAESDQSEKITTAINEVSGMGGGVLYIPKGVYDFGNIEMKSNVHILIEAGTVIKPEFGKKRVFTFAPSKEETKARPEAFIENASIRGVGGDFIIDYHDRKTLDKQRAIMLRMVKNFLVSDMTVKDNYSTFCGVTLAPSDEKELDVSGWEVSRPTQGTLRNITHYKGSPGYGLVQCHGAQSVHFENLYSLGGVTFRLEVGANNKNVGVYDLYAKNIINENGRSAILFGPHSAKNGVVTVDGVKSIGSSWAIVGGNSSVKEDAPDQTPGFFDSRSSVKNITAIWGLNSQFKGNNLLKLPNRDHYDEIKQWTGGKFFEGPSFGGVLFTATRYSISFENIKVEGFPYYSETPLLTGGFEREGNVWAEKSYWEDNHVGDEWQSDKGVINDDYTIDDVEDSEYILTAIHDAFVDTNIGQNTELLTTKSSESLAYISFDMSGIPTDLTTGSIELTIINNTSITNIDVFNGSNIIWDSNSIDNSTAPVLQNRLGGIENESFDMNQRISIPLTDLKRESNILNLIISQNGGGKIDFASREHSILIHRPKLTINEINSETGEGSEDESLSVKVFSKSGEITIINPTEIIQNLNNTYSVYNISGVLVGSTTSNAVESKINLSHLSHGVYILHVKNKSTQEITVTKFIHTN